MSDSETFSLPKAELIALFVESLVFGAFTVLYGIAIWILLYRDAKRNKTFRNKMLFTISTLMWLLSVSHLGIDIQRALDGFVKNGGVKDGTLEYYSNLNEPLHIAKDTIFITMTLLGDGFVSYRLWIVWNRAWWVIILPVMLLLGTAVSGYGACFEYTLINDAADIFTSDLQPFILSFFALSLSTNMICTIMITARIMWSNRRVRQYRAGVSGATSQWDVIETLIQSAAIYSAALASLLGTYVAGSNAQYVCLDILQPLIGVVFTLIIIRVGLGYTLDSTTGPARGGPSDHRGFTGIGGGVGITSGTGQLSANEYQLRPVAINVSVQREHDRSSLDLYDRKDGADLETGTAA